MRKVRVFEYIKGLAPNFWAKEYKCDGVFHSFGVNYEEFESGVGNYTTAIVELSSGEIIQPQIELVEFIVKPKSKELPVKKEELDFSVLGFTDIQCTELIRIRKKNKGGALTQRVIDALAREFRLGSGNAYHIDDMLTEWEVRGWKSFKAEWMKSGSKQQSKKVIVGRTEFF